MRAFKYLCLLIGMSIAFAAQAQFDPVNPPEPGGYTVQAKARPTAGGSVSPASRTVQAGESVTLTATPSTGYKFLRWEDAAGKSLSVSRSYSFNMPMADVTCYAIFEYSPNNPDEPSQPVKTAQVTAKVVPVAAGSVSGTGKFNVGAKASLRASANTGYRFVNWTSADGTVLGTSTTLSYTVLESDNSLTANFKYDPSNPDEPAKPAVLRKVFVASSPAGAATFNVTSGKIYNEGSSITLQAYAATGYRFRSWTDRDGNELSNSSSLSYTVPDHDSYLTANLVYSPNNPDEPGTPSPTRNVIYGARETLIPGGSMIYNISLENVDEANGMNVDLTVPDGLTFNVEEAALSSRTEEHSLSCEAVGASTWRFSVKGTHSFAGANGPVIRIAVSAPADAAIGTTYEVGLSKGVIYRADGSQAPIDAVGGTLKIVPSPETLPDSPDFVIRDLGAGRCEVMPGDEISVSWSVANDGTADATGGWSENIYLADGNGHRALLSSLYYDGTGLGQGQAVSRSATVRIPDMPGIDGSLDVMVVLTPYATSGEIEHYQNNNTSRTTDTPVTLGKRLLLEMPESVTEKQTSTVRCKLSRTGSWADSQTFSLSLINGDDRLGLPGEILIPKNQSSAYFNITVDSNGRFDDNEIVSLHIEGNGYPEITNEFRIVDDTEPALTLKASKDTVTEGGSLELYISLPKVLETDVRIFLASDNNALIALPDELVIPAGQKEVCVPVSVSDNDLAEPDSEVTIRVTSTGFDGDETYVTVLDNDMPELEMTLSPSSISESAGYGAVLATITRRTNADKEVRLKLYDDSNGVLHLSQTSVIMEKGVESIQVMIDVNDNDLVDSDRKFNVMAAVYLSTCNCYGDDETGGYVSAPLTVVDDDGPHLTLTSSAQSFLEGSSENIITVKRNNGTDKELIVTLSSDRDDMLEYEHTAVIPAGAVSTDIKVAVKGNDQPDDSSIASFTASADGMGDGTCWVVITDRTLPDATLEMMLAQQNPLAGDVVDLILTVGNVGSAPLPANTSVKVSVTGTTGSHKAATTSEIAPGGSERVVIEDLALPAKVGPVTISATVNYDGKVSELLTSNNSAGNINLNLAPAFEAEAFVDKSRYNQKEEVVITGHANGNAGKNAAVEIHLDNDGFVTRLTTTTDNDGKFSYTHKLMSRQTGHFKVGAGFPSASSVTMTDEFDVTGLVTTTTYTSFEIGFGDVQNDTIVVKNPGRVKQNGIRITPLVNPENCLVKFDAPTSIDAGGQIEVKYSIEATGLTKGYNFEEIPVEITSDEGSKTTFMIYYYIQSKHGQLNSSTKSINTTMLKDFPRDYPLTIRNVGFGETGQISFSLPGFMKAVTPENMSSLAPGDSVTVMLRFNPTSDMKLNVATKGYLGINCSNGDGMSIPFSITPVSDAIGTLTIDVVDELTFLTDEAPHVTGASVKICNPSTGVVVANGETGNNGIFSVKLNEGYYTMTVEADHHNPYTENIIVSPGTTLEKEVFMPYQTVTYSWNVEPTEIEDEYVMETVADYYTRVPSPRIVVSLPDEKPEPYTIMPVIVSNQGVLNALDVNISMTITGGLSLEFLNENYCDVLAPEQSMVIYVKVLPENASQKVLHKNARAGAENCVFVETYVKHKRVCNKYTGEWEDKIVKRYGYWSCINDGDGDGDGNDEDFDSDKDKDKKKGGGGGGTYPRPKGPNVWNHIINKYISETGGFTLGNPGRSCVRRRNNDNNGNNNGNNGNGGNGGGDDDGGDDPNSPDYYGDPDRPIKRPIISDNSVPPQDDCKDEPTLSFKLVPVSGTRYSLRGVAADGVSQVKIVLDPEESKIPAADCNNIVDGEWRLSEELGTIEKISDWEAIYTAPAHFEGSDSIKTITATYWYTQQTSENVTHGRHSDPVEIEIIRAPLVLIHGLNDRGYDPNNMYGDKGCWTKLYKRLKSDGLYKNCNIVRMDYHDTHSSAFSVNYGFVNYEIERLKKCTLSHGFVSTKCDIVGHSMGGILARLHVQNGGEDNVNRIITVNTPHSGSEIGDAVKAHNAAIANLARLATFDTDIDAIYDLAVESPAIASLNSGSKSDIPVYALATQTNTLIPELAASIKAGLDNGGQALITKPPYGTIIGILMKYSKHFLDDISQVGAGDLVVSTESQEGGCDASTVFYDGPWHCNSPKNDNVMTMIEGLLKISKESSTFSRNWFDPTPRNFDHSAVWAAEEAGDIIFDLALDDIGEGFKNGDLDDIVHNQFKDKITKDEAADMLKVLGYMKTYVNVKKDFNKIHTEHMRVNASDVELGEGEYITNVISFEYPDTTLIKNPSAMFVFENGYTDFCVGPKIRCCAPTTFSGNVKIILLGEVKDDLYGLSSFEVTIEEPATTPVALEADEMILDLGETASMRVRCIWEDGSETDIVPDNVTFGYESLARFENGKITGAQVGCTKAKINYNGLETECMVHVFGPETDGDDDDDSDAICSTVTLAFRQTAVMTRQAFRGMFTVNNGHETTTLRDFTLSLEVKDANGNVASKREFEIVPEKLDGFKGKLDFASGWTLEPSSNGSVQILFIPSRYAAPTEPVVYSFGGSFSYVDPFTGFKVTHTINPVDLTVNPSPVLDLTYFMQRDVYADDPLTPDVVEATQPAEFALVINNRGNGDAKDLRMVTNQPEIVENEKGLLIDFALTGSQLNGEEMTLSLGGQIATEFGDIPANSTAYAQWWLESSLLGHFTEYDVEATHVTSYGNPDLSLLDNVSIHELIHGFTADGGARPVTRAFLVNDIADVEDKPDMVYFSDGAEEQPVSEAESVRFWPVSDTVSELTVKPSQTGWTYATAYSTGESRRIVSVVRKSDGRGMPADMIWLTDVTLRDGKDPVHENRVHAAALLAGEETFIVTFEPAPDRLLEVEQFVGVPEEGNTLTRQLTSVGVSFNKAVDAATFTAEDLTLTCQGERVDLAGATVQAQTATDFMIDLSAVTLADGYYVLTVQTAGITDSDGFTGKAGKSCSWVQFVDGKVAVSLKCSPADGGSVSPASGRYDLGSTLTVTATPAEGYDFSHWTSGGAEIGRDLSVALTLDSDVECTAVFVRRQYSVVIDFDPAKGSVENAASGIYEHGTTLSLVAVPNPGYSFLYWTVNDEKAGTDPHFGVDVTSQMTLHAEFAESGSSIDGVDAGSGRFTVAPLPLHDVMTVCGPFRSIAQLVMYDVSGKAVMQWENLPAVATVEVPGLADGFYVVKAVTDNGIHTMKVLKK